jgi:hypothetical protein
VSQLEGASGTLSEGGRSLRVHHFWRPKRGLEGRIRARLRPQLHSQVCTERQLHACLVVILGRLQVVSCPWKTNHTMQLAPWLSLSREAVTPS